MPSFTNAAMSNTIAVLPRQLYVQVQSCSVAQAACDLELGDCGSIGRYSPDSHPIAGAASKRSAGTWVRIRAVATDRTAIPKLQITGGLGHRTGSDLNIQLPRQYSDRVAHRCIRKARHSFPHRGSESADAERRPNEQNSNGFGA